jgi:ferritin
MNKFNIRVARDIVTFETIELTDEQIMQFKKWLIEGQGYDEKEVEDLVEIGASYLYDWLGEEDIETVVVKTYSQTDVNYK